MGIRFHPKNITIALTQTAKTVYFSIKVMDKYIFKQDLAEHCKLMADFFKHLSVLSITFIVLGVGLYSNLLNFKASAWLLLLAIILFLCSSIVSVFAQISYIETFRVPELFNGFPLSNKIAKPTTIAFLLFIFGAVAMGAFVIVNVVEI
jgi:hypothetical protein